MKNGRFIKKIYFYYPFTISGTILFSISIFLLGRGWASGNPYGLMLSLTALLILAAIVIGGRMQAVSFDRLQIQWDSSRPLQARRQGLEHIVWAEGKRTFYFYRLHFTLRGKMTVGQNASLYVYQETSFTGGGSQVVPLYFPLCGIFHAKGSFKVMDIFGLTRAVFGSEQVRELTVQPLSLSDSESLPVEAMAGLEQKQRRKSSDEEKYYMREYIPGDRFRDINWKVSSRLSELFTRISPVTQEKTKSIAVEFRHFRRQMGETVESIVHLNYIKGWLLSFLRSIKKDNPEYHFIILTGSGKVRLETEEDITRFAGELGSIFFQTDPYEPDHDPGVSEIFIFTTPYDDKLPSILQAHPETKLHVFRTVYADSDLKKNRTTVCMFKPFTLHFLPGSWIILRDKDLAGPKIGAYNVGRINEEALEVRVFG